MTNAAKVVTTSWVVCNIAAVVSFVAGGVAVIGTAAKLAAASKG